jgi:hypothetical protein
MMKKLPTKQKRRRGHGRATEDLIQTSLTLVHPIWSRLVYTEESNRLPAM